ncbi:hypothetical protein DK847_06585 [Aestuariivirga litoralis]|uniref:NnrT protein n=1 Tax=Aestuariivirga litoralis TaxID=2650924 RepID=A0A2W2ARU3_9HYPH|nr:hypothetical protein DK847_06585 [Aestuariivirga litoralis]
MKKRAEDIWPVWKLGLLLYPFATAAVAVNLFMLALLGSWIGLGTLSPMSAVWLSLPLGIPATWASALWVQRLLVQASR